MMILVEMQLRDMPEAEAACQFVTQVMPGVLERVQRFLLFAFVASDGDPDRSVPPIGTDVGLDYLYGEQMRIIGLKPDDLRQLLPNCFGDP